MKRTMNCSTCVLWDGEKCRDGHCLADGPASLYKCYYWKGTRINDEPRDHENQVSLFGDD